jgi:hypothetical protein
LGYKYDLGARDFLSIYVQVVSRIPFTLSLI